MDKTVLSRVTFRLGSHPENVATEALLFILDQHTPAEVALRTLLASRGLPELPALHMTSQAVGKDGSIPDLVGKDMEGRSRLIIEAKFWADLTENQPDQYIGQLPGDAPSVLLFLVPGAREVPLWHKIKQRAQAKGVVLSEELDASPLRRARLDEQRYLALVSWRSLLDSLAASAVETNDRAFASDVEQLKGLCDRMDEDEFLPYRLEEFSQETGRRVAQLPDLIDGCVTYLQTHIGVVKAETGGSRGAFGRFFGYLDRVGARLEVSPALWSRYGASPLWLALREIVGRKWEPTPRVTEILKRVAATRSSTFSADLYDPAIAVTLPIGVERQEVVVNVANQIQEILKAVHIGLGEDR
jgi:hypothetical protein